MGFLGAYQNDQQLPPWLASYFANAPTSGADPNAAPMPTPMPAPTPAPMPTPMAAPDPSAGKTATPAAHPGFLARIGQAVHSPDFRFRLMAGLAAASGNPQAAMQYEEFRQQQAIRNQDLQRQLRAEQRTEGDQANQVWGLKESGLFSNPQIAAMTPEQRGAAMSARVAPYVLSPGQSRHVAGDVGQPEQVTTAPIADAQMGDWLDTQDPTGGLRRLYAAHQAMPPIAIQAGGASVGAVSDGQGGYRAGYVVQPDTAPQPSGAPSGTGGGGTSGNNPGGLRYPGSTQFRNFPTPAAGIAAGQAQLGRYMQRGINTVRNIVETWAPRRSRGGDNSDESVNNYIGHVASRLGVNPDQPLPPSAIPQIFAAQTEFETGHRASGGAPSATPSAPPPRASNNSDALRQARAAIRMGADPAAVRARLRQAGVNDAGL